MRTPGPHPTSRAVLPARSSWSAAG